MEEDSIAFIKGLEEQLGAKITWRTFATWYASTEGTIREYGVFLCRCQDSFYFEDFDRVPTLLGIPLNTKNRPKYEKYSRLIPVSEVKSLSRVSKKLAEQQARSQSQKPLPEAGRMSRLMSPQVTQLVLESGECLYFELIDHKEIIKELEKQNGSL